VKKKGVYAYFNNSLRICLERERVMREVHKENMGCRKHKLRFVTIS